MHIKIILPHSAGKAGSYKQPLIQQIVHAAFNPLGRGSIFLAIVTSSTIFIAKGGGKLNLCLKRQLIHRFAPISLN
jgi:hypothetical protein